MGHCTHCASSVCCPLDSSMFLWTNGAASGTTERDVYIPTIPSASTAYFSFLLKGGSDQQITDKVTSDMRDGIDTTYPSFGGWRLPLVGRGAPYRSFLFCSFQIVVGSHSIKLLLLYIKPEHTLIRISKETMKMISHIGPQFLPLHFGPIPRGRSFPQ